MYTFLMQEPHAAIDDKNHVFKANQNQKVNFQSTQQTSSQKRV